MIPGNPNKPNEHSDKRKHKVRARYISHSSSSEESQSSVQVKKSSHPKRAPSEQDKQQTDPDPVFYMEVDMSDLPSQYTEEAETFRHVLNRPDPGKLCLGPLPLFWCWMMKKVNWSSV